MPVFPIHRNAASHYIGGGVLISLTLVKAYIDYPVDPDF